MESTLALRDSSFPKDLSQECERRLEYSGIQRGVFVGGEPREPVELTSDPDRGQEH